jgi:hypothetical protein
MRDNTLLLVLCGILTVIILYYIFKSCDNSSGYSNKINTYNNDNRIVKLNKKNEHMTRELFESTDDIFNINDFIKNNNIKYYFSTKTNNSNVINVDYNGPIITFKNNTGPIFLFIHKLNYFKSVERGNYVYESHINSFTEGDYNYRDSIDNCGIAFNELDSLFKLTMGLPHVKEKFDTPFFKGENKTKYLKLDTKLTKANKVHIISKTPDTDKKDEIAKIIGGENEEEEFYISTYKKKQFAYNNEKKSLTTVYDKVNTKNTLSDCGLYSDSTYLNTFVDEHDKPITGLMGVSDNDDYDNDIIPYKFEDIIDDFKENMNMFYINKDNLQVVYDDNKFKLKLKENEAKVKVIYFKEENNTITITDLKAGENLLSNSIVMGVIIPIGKAVKITYKKIKSKLELELLDENNASTSKSFDDISNSSTIILSESTLYIDRHIQNAGQNTFTNMTYTQINGEDYEFKSSVDGSKKTERENIIADIKAKIEKTIKGIYMTSHYDYVNRLHNKEHHIQINSIVELTEPDESGLNTSYYLDYESDSTDSILEVSNKGRNLKVNFECHEIDYEKMFIEYKVKGKDLNDKKYLVHPIKNNQILHEVEQTNNENTQFESYSIQIKIKKDGNKTLYYEIVDTDYKLYIFATESDSDYLIFIGRSGSDYKFLKHTTTGVDLTHKYEHENRGDYLFNLTNYEERQNTVSESFSTTPKHPFNKYINSPIIVDTNSPDLDMDIKTSLYNYQSGIYTPNRYLTMTKNYSLKTNNNEFITTVDTNFDITLDELEYNKVYIDRPGTMATFERGDNVIVKKYINMYLKKSNDNNNKYNNISGLTYGAYLILKNSNNHYLHCTFNIKKTYEFHWKESIHFYSLYKNGVLHESNSPFFTIDQIPGAVLNTSQKRMVFAISDYRVHLEKDNNKKLLAFTENNEYMDDNMDGNTDENKTHTHYKQFNYYEMKNVFDTPRVYKSSPDIQIDIKNINMTFIKSVSKESKELFEFEYDIELPSDSRNNNIFKNDKKYTFDYEVDIRGGIFYSTLDKKEENNKYMSDYTKDMEMLVGCLSNKEYQEDYIENTVICNDADVGDGSLNVSIKNLKNIKTEKENITKKLLSNLTLYKNQAIKTIKQTIIPKQKELYELINEIYTKNKEIEKMNYKLQNKIQFSFNISRNITYLEYLKQENKKANENLKELKTKMELEKSNKYKNLLKVNQYILKINKNINNINSYLEKTGNIKEQFYEDNNYDKGQLYKEINTYNINVENHFKNIKKLSKIIREKVNVKHKLNYEIKLNDKVIEYYTQLITIFKNEQISNNDFMYSDEYRRLSGNNYMKILGDLVLSLNKKKMELQNKLKHINEKHLNTKRKLAKNNFKQVDYKVDFPQVASLEIDLIITYNKINDLKQSINNDHLLKDAQHKLELIKNLNLTIKDEGVNKYNALESFVSSSSNNDLNKRFNTIQSHKDGYLSVLPIDNSNEYKININGKCLSSYSSNDYNLQTCENKQSQYFEPRLINSKFDSESTNKDRVNNNDVEYPYYQMVSSLSRDCLIKEGENVSITPCSSNNKNQRWNLIENEVKCLDN